MDISRESYLFLGEVFITDDALAAGPIAVLSTLLHEAGHSVAESRGVKDTSRQGRYHNARFKTVAEELGYLRRRSFSRWVAACRGRLESLTFTVKE